MRDEAGPAEPGHASQPWRAWLHGLAGPVVIACGVGAGLWTQAVMLATVGIVMLLAPPRRGVPAAALAGMAVLALLPLAAFLPAAWMGALPEWRQALVETWSTPLPGTWSGQPWVSFESWLMLVCGLVWLASCLGQGFDETERRVLLRVLAAGIVVLAAVSVWERWADASVPWWPRNEKRWGEGFGPFTNRNHSSSLFAIGCVLCAAVSYDGFRAGWRGWPLHAAGILVTLAGIFMNTSRAGLVLVFLGFTAWIATSAMRQGLFRKLAVTGALLILALAIILTARGGVGSRLKDMTLDHAAAPGLRQALAEESVRIVNTAPWAGAGLGNFSAVYAMTTRLHHPVYHVLHPESDVVWLLFEAGIPALLTALLLAGWLVSGTGPWGNSSGSVRRGERADLRLRRAAGIATALALVHAVFDVPMHRLAYFLVVAVLAALALRTSFLGAACGRLCRTGFRLAGAGALLLGAGYQAIAMGFWTPPSGSTAHWLHEQAVIESAAGRHSAAFAMTDLAVSHAPLNFRLYYLRAQLRLKLRQSSETALTDFNRARALEPGHAGVCYDEGVYWLAYRPVFAIIPWRECLRRDPQAARGIHGHFQQMLNQMGRHPELAEPLWQLADQAELQVLYLNSAPAGEQWLQRLDKLLASNPRLRISDKTALKMLFDAWARKGDPARLVAGLRQNPEWLAYGWPHLAEAEAREGRYRDACELAVAQLPPTARFTSLGVADIPRLERVVAMNPGDPKPALELYHALRASGDYKAALRMLEKIASLPQPPAFLRREMAALHMKMEEYQRAWEILQQIIHQSA